MRKAFTLIELLLVMAVVSILIGITLPAFRGMLLEANRTKTDKELSNVQAAIEAYYKNYGSYPASPILAFSCLTGASSILQTTPIDYFKTVLVSGNIYTYSYATGLDYSRYPYYIVASRGRDLSYTSTYNSLTTAIFVVGDNAVATNMLKQSIARGAY